VIVLLPLLNTPAQQIQQYADEDENEYGWTSSYYGSRLARLDFSPGTDLYGDPGWAPLSFWALTQPMGARYLYSIALGLSDQPGQAPPSPSFVPPHHPGPLAASARAAMRLMAIACASAGLGLIGWRLGWLGLAVTAVFLALPAHVNLALGWAEGPLLLGAGLCVASYGKRWFPLALGLAAAFKLTALGLWPLIFVRGAAGRWSRLVGAGLTLGVWTVLTPPSWFFYGPLYLALMAWDRFEEYWVFQRVQIATQPGLYAPSRYLWPFELAALVGLALALRWSVGRRRTLVRLALGLRARHSNDHGPTRLLLWKNRSVS
jgi:hypothetical protein